MSDEKDTKNNDDSIEMEGIEIEKKPEEGSTGDIQKDKLFDALGVEKPSSHSGREETEETIRKELDSNGGIEFMKGEAIKEWEE